jgi:hypothetical protein
MDWCYWAVGDEMRSAELNGQNRGEIKHFHMECSGTHWSDTSFSKERILGVRKNFTKEFPLFSQFVLHVQYNGVLLSCEVIDSVKSSVLAITDVIGFVMPSGQRVTMARQRSIDQQASDTVRRENRSARRFGKIQYPKFDPSQISQSN